MIPEPIQTRRYVDIALFSAAGSVLEIFFGSIAHTLRIIPFSGLFPATALIMVLAALYAYRRSAGDIIFCGTVIALLKLLSPGGTGIFSISGVLIETGLMAIPLRFMRGSLLLRVMSSGMLVSVWPVIQRLLILTLFVGVTMGETLRKICSLLNMDTINNHPAAAVILLLILVIHAVAGAAGALIGWRLGQQLKRVSGATQ